ncbi:MAG: PAS domain S-box protein [Phycisphaeraceae bacterium]
MSVNDRASDEERRVKSLHDMHLTERATEPAITTTLEATAEAIDCPISTVSLIDSEREIFFATVGVERCSAPREQGFCARTIESDDLLVVEDARRDPRFAGGAQVTERGIVFYAGVALHSPDGMRIGALSVRDRRPRTLDDKQRRTLRRMAAIAESQLIGCADRWKRVQAQLLLDGVMKSSHDAVLLLEPIRDERKQVTDFRICSASSSAECIPGFQSGGLRNRPLSSLSTGRMKPEKFERLLRVASTGQPDQFECDCCHQGCTIWHNVSVARWRDGLAMTLHDITDHKLTEHQFNDMFEMAKDLLCIVDHRGRYVRVNSAFEQMLGIPQARLIECLALDFVDPRDIERTRRLIATFAGELRISEYENRLRNHDGQTRWIHWGLQPVADSPLVFGVGRDVTDERRVRRRLRESERFDRAVIDALGEAISIVDQTGLILNVNRAWKDFARNNGGDPHSRTLCEGVNYLEVCRRSAEKGDTDAELVAQGIERVLAGESDNFEHTYPCDSPAEQRRFTVTVTGFAHHRRLCAVISHHDITSRMEADLQIQQVLNQMDSQTEEVNGLAREIDRTLRIDQAAESDHAESIVSPGSPPRFPQLVWRGSSAPPRFSGRVLVAEDCDDNQRLIRFLLERRGLTVDRVGDGRQAMDHALAAWHLGDPYAVTLMDIQMPVMDGLEAVRRLREAGYVGPVVALTAYTTITDREKCLAEGCDDYIAKPIDRSQLEQVIARWLQPVDQATPA